MAYRKPVDLDGFIQMMPKADMRVKVQLAEDLVSYLTDENNPIASMDVGMLVDGLMPWLTGSHFKIAQKSLEAFTELIKRIGPDFNAYTSTVLPHVIDRLGDSKDIVREKAQLLLQNLIEYKVVGPQALLDKLSTSCFRHKNAKVREELLQTIVNTLNEYGTSQISVRTYIPSICGLLGDPIATVRDASIQTLVEIYKHVGDRIRPDLRRMDDISPSKLAILEQKFDQVKSEGLLLKSALQNAQSNNNFGGQDEADNIGVRERPSKIVKRTVSASTRGKVASSESSIGDAGAVTMEIFEASFEVVPQLTIFHPKDMDDVYKSILVIISDKNADWERRVDSLKRIRSLLMLNVQSQPQFAVQLKELSISFLDILKEELRSQVIREACITIAYMSKVLRNKLEQFCIYILEQLINLIQNSAKVIASSSLIALKYIIKYTHAGKILKIISDTLQQSKSKDIRSSLCEVLCLLLEEWQTKSLEKSSLLLRDTLKKSLSDADNDARKHSRRAYWLFRQHFPDLADQIYGNLDIAAQRALERERNGSVAATPDDKRGLPVMNKLQRTSGSLQKPGSSIRSISAVDVDAAQRAKARVQYSLFARKKVNNNANQPGSNTGSLPRPRPLTGTNSNNQNFNNQQQQNLAQATPSRSRGRTGVSQSQPGSRSTSPSSKLREQQYGMYRPTGTIPKKASGIPRSLVSSRETSPTRIGSNMKRSVYNTGSARRTPERNTPTRPLAAARLLQQSREAEHVLSDALSPDGNNEYNSMGDYSGVRTFGLYSTGLRSVGRKYLTRDESDDSEASSVCSERSFDSSYTRGNSSNYSLSGSRNRLDWSCTRAPFSDIDTIIQYCASTHWSERKDGLNSLTQYLADGKDLTPQQLQCVLDMFRKMFLDSHIKVYSIFLDTVTELILAHANDLHDWLFILLTRLFNKLGADLLNSMNGKIWKTLQVVHEYFPTHLQLKEVLRAIADSALTPHPKTKLAIYKFLTNLVSTYCKNTDFLPEETQPFLEKALVKIVQSADDQKSAELRGEARRCLIAMYNLNTPHMTKILSNLNKTSQDIAKKIIQIHLRKSSTSGNDSPNSSPLSSSSPKLLQSPSVNAPFQSLQTQFNTSPRSRKSSIDNELYSELDVQHNIHKTSEEIRNCFGSGGGGGGNGSIAGVSSSSGISSETIATSLQYHSLSNAPNGLNGHLNDSAHDSFASNSNSNSKTQSAATTESNTPENTIRLDANLLEQNHKLHNMPLMTSSVTTSTSNAPRQRVDYIIGPDGEIILDNVLTESEIIKTACNLTNDMPAAQLHVALSNLGICIKVGNCELPNKHFRAIMKMLLNLLDSQALDVVIAALHVLSKIIRSEQMKPNWINFLELILLRIINCYRIGKEVQREIDMIFPRIVPALPLNPTINIVNPVIATGAFPMNLCAVKLLTELADRHGKDLTESHLDTVFENLARRADDLNSMVRKAVVFCIVKLYLVMGEEKVKPKFGMLNSSKIRLLNVYIDKQRSLASGGSSTKNSSAASSS